MAERKKKKEAPITEQDGVLIIECDEIIVPLPKPRAMTRREMRAMREAGVDPAINDAMVGDNAVDAQKVGAGMVDYILDTIYPDFDFDNVPYDECLRFAGKIYALTMGGVMPDEVKNS